MSTYGFETVEPAAADFDAARLKDAVDYFQNHESSWPRELGAATELPGMTAIEPPPWNEIIGPLKDRGGPNGLILRGGCLVAEWGDVERVDMTFSVAKSYLAILAGVAAGEGLLPDLDRPVHDQLALPEFASDQNRSITWRHLLTQSSEWQGTLFGKPDVVDHNRTVGDGAGEAKKGQERALQAPGTFYEYNDVRVNVLSLALLHLFQEPLPEVLKRTIMDPIGASGDWAWHGYRNAEVTVAGRPMISVPGGTHWGGGIWISSPDHARVGLLIANDGVHDGRHLLPAGWVDAMWTPSACKKDYGLLWWLNTDGMGFPGLPETSAMALGAGSNIIWVDRDLDLVVVARWIDADHRIEACRLVFEAML